MNKSISITTYVQPSISTFIRCISHRSRDNLLKLFPNLQSFYNFQIESHKGVYLIHNQNLPNALSIKGISKLPSKFQDPSLWHKCFK